MADDFPTSTPLNDGTVSPIELIRRTSVKGYLTITLTDDINLGSPERIIAELTLDCNVA